MSTSLERYDDWHGLKAAGEEEPQPTAIWHQMAARYLGDVQGLRVLEIGCGRGAFAKLLAKQGANVVAADFSPTAVEHAAALLEPYANAEARVIDVQRIPYDTGSFDLVVSLETLEHVPDPDQGLAELVRVTRPGGRLIVTTPNYFSLVGLSRLLLKLAGREFTEGGQPINHPLFLYRRVRALKRLGCRVTAVDGSDHSFSIPGYRSVTLRFLERPHRFTKWFARHGCTVATKR